MFEPSPTSETLDLAAPAPGRPLRVVLVAFYNYEAHAIRIFHPLLRRRGHDVHSIFFKNYFTYQVPTQQEEDMVVDLIARIRPDLVAMSVWSTYYQLAARLSRRIKAATGALIIWGGIHPQTCPEDCLQHADLVARGEGEYVLAELTDRLSVGQAVTGIPGTWARSAAEVVKNPPRMLIPDLDVLPPADLSPDNKYYLGHNAWRDVASWDRKAIAYDIMMVRGCPFECTFCIHNFTRTFTKGLGTYVRRRSVDHVMRELRAAVAQRPQLRAVAFSDDIFAPPRPWLEEFCARYKEEIGLPFIMYSFPRMVDEKRIRLMREAGLWATTMGIQSGSERIRRDCYERETSNAEIVEACEILARHGVVRNLDFIGDNPFESDADRAETVALLARLPKPFYFNYFSLTYFPGVELTERALAAGYIKREEVEDVAQKGYHLWGGSLVSSRAPENLRWDVAYTMAVHGVPERMALRVTRTRFFRRHLHRFVRAMRGVQEASRLKARLVDTVMRRPNLLMMFRDNTNRDSSPGAPSVQPNFDNSPFGHPIPALRHDAAS
ncbi:MAG TPA: radical SAM protein [Candidatus Binatia bacterium]|nr:radical SAM protein [Candidatus Binatia bacterium]